MAGQDSYWASLTQARVSRRRALGAAGAGVLSAGFLAACGGGSDSSSKGGGPASLVTKPADTSPKAVKGGIFQGQLPQDPNAFDVITGTAADVNHPARAYSRIIKYQAYKYPEKVQPAAAPDAAVSWEFSGDGTQV